ncbi:hypothetical protein UlMin_001588 [Ulmus minor]
MADKTSSTTSNTQDITIKSIKDSLLELQKAITDEIKKNEATTTGGKGGYDSTDGQKEKSHHASDESGKEVEKESEIKSHNATTTGGQGGDSSTFDQKDRPDHAVDDKIAESSRESEPNSICNVLPKWVFSCGTGKEHDRDERSSRGSARGDDGEVKLSPAEFKVYLTDKLNLNVDQMKDALDKLQRYEKELHEKIKRSKQTSTDAMKKLKATQLSGAGSSSSSGAQDDENKILQELVKEVRKLRHQIPTLHKSSFKDSGAHDRDSGSSIDGVRTNMEIYNLPSMQMSTSFQQSSVVTEIGEIYEGLESQKKKDCLLCFAVFPENEELKKRTLTYWWEGEDLLPPEDGKRVEKLARDLLDDFVKKGLIEPSYKKGRKKARSYRMNPIVHGVVAKIAEEEKFFVYDVKGNPTATFTVEKNEKICTKACLLKAEKVTATPEQQEKTGNGKKKNGSKDAKGEPPDFTVEMKVETIFNFNEPFPDLRMESFAKKKEADVAEWLSKMEKLKVLHLGRWQASVKHHVEVEKTDFLEGLKKMGNLRLLSLQGVSRIDELTRSIKGLTNLKILDLKACHNLEVLPKEISYLKNLTHLDLSDCYLIDHMPKGLSNLTNLLVLEGFVVGDEQSQRTKKYCSLDGLGGMQKLWKLSLNISKRDFPSTEELTALGKLTSLKTLTMSWGADLNPQESAKSTHEPKKDVAVKGKGLKRLPTIARPSQFPSGLEKLSLLCFPHVESPTWLVPDKLPKLLKLCIRGGDFGELKKNDPKWSSVKTLRLKFLKEVKISWEELQAEFPNLECLEKVGCPRITFCPCDENGVWVTPNEEGKAGTKQSEEAEKDKKSEQSGKPEQSKS